MRCNVAHREADADAFDAMGALRHQRDAIALGIG